MGKVAPLRAGLHLGHRTKVIDGTLSADEFPAGSFISGKTSVPTHRLAWTHRSFWGAEGLQATYVNAKKNLCENFLTLKVTFDVVTDTGAAFFLDNPLYNKQSTTVSTPPGNN